MRAWRLVGLGFAFIACAASEGIDGDASDELRANDPVVAPAEATNVPQFRWDFETKSARDVSGAGLDGVVEGTIGWVAGELPGKLAAAPKGEAAIVLDGAERIADISAAESFRIEVGFRTDVHGRDGDAGGGTLVARDAEGQSGFRVAVEDGRVTFRVWSKDGPASTVTSRRVVVDDRWHRLTAVRDRRTRELVLILDGMDVVRAPDGTTELVSTAPITVFRSSASPRRFVGLIDEVAFVRAAVTAPPAAAERAVSRVFEAGKEGYSTYRIPTVVRSRAGALLAFAEGRVHDECDFGDIDVVMKRSTDGGATWSPVKRVVDAGLDKAGNPIPIATASGKIVLLSLINPLDQATCGPTSSDCSCKRNDQIQRVAVVTSDDDGVTWSARKDITNDVRKPEWGGILLGPAHGIQIERGPNAGMLVVAAKHDRSGHLLTSKDDGATWAIGATEAGSRVNVNESTLAELSDGSILVNARHNVTAPDVDDAQRALGFRAEARLSSALAYASSPAFARTPRFRGPVVQGSLLSLRGSERFGDERRVLFSYPAGQHGTNVGQRHDLRVYASRDDGSTWSPGARVVGGWAAYSDLVALPGGAVGALHETGRRFYGQIDFVRFSLEMLDERTVASFGFESRDRPFTNAGGASISLDGTPELVPGRHHSTAARFDGTKRACATAAEAAGWLDFGRNDSFAVEATFRTTAHATGDAPGSGALVSRTALRTPAAYWLRIENGKVRFHVASCEAENSNCGVVPGTCAALTACSAKSVHAGPIVTDGRWHHVRAVRDAVAGKLVLEVDGVRAGETALPAGGIVKNEEPFCVGAFADGDRPFRGDIDGVRVELVD
jgi:sialidase-1